MEDNRRSCFASVPGIAVLLVLAVTAIYTRAFPIAFFLTVVTLLVIASRFWSRRVLSRIEVQAQTASGCAHVGEHLQLSVSVRNRSLFPVIWMDVVFPTGAHPVVCQTDGEGQEKNEKNEKEPAGIRERLMWLWWQQEVSWEEELLALRRGSVELSGVLLHAGDGIGMSVEERWKRFQTPRRLMVYPELVPVRTQSFLRIVQEAMAGSRGQAEDVTVLKSSRAYQPGDPARRINWRLLAVSGRMEVNVYEKIMPGCVTFVLDLQSFLKTRTQKGQNDAEETLTFFMERDFEGMISLVASCLQAVCRQGVQTALLIPGYGSQDAVFGAPGKGEDALRLCMDALALVHYRGETQRFPYEEFRKRSHQLGNVYLCVRTEKGCGLTALADGIGQSRVHFLAWRREEAREGENDLPKRPDGAAGGLPKQAETSAGDGFWSSYYADDLMLERPSLETVPEETAVDAALRRA